MFVDYLYFFDILANKALSHVQPPVKVYKIKLVLGAMDSFSAKDTGIISSTFSKHCRKLSGYFPRNKFVCLEM